MKNILILILTINLVTVFSNKVFSQAVTLPNFNNKTTCKITQIQQRDLEIAATESWQEVPIITETINAGESAPVEFTLTLQQMLKIYFLEKSGRVFEKTYEIWRSGITEIVINPDFTITEN